MARDLEPIFDICETKCPAIVEKRIGDTIQGIIDGIVIEKTKSYIIVAVNSVCLLEDRRKY